MYIDQDVCHLQTLFEWFYAQDILMHVNKINYVQCTIIF